MKREHRYEWTREILAKGLKHDPGMQEELLGDADRTFNLRRFYELLVDWVVHDDMVSLISPCLCGLYSRLFSL